jgi:threonine dehydratase
MRLVPVPPDVARSPAPSLEVARGFHERFAAVGVRRCAVFRAEALDVRADPSGATRVWLAYEHLQTTGSFKVRGALLATAHAKANGVSVVTASAGNHGAGLAFAAHHLGVDATVVVPLTAPGKKKDRIARYGATLVEVHGSYDDAETHAKELARASGARFVSPYDDDEVVLGNGASLGLEIVDALDGIPDVVLAPFGGGGLATGLAWAFVDAAEERLGEVRRVYGVQSEVSPVMAKSLVDGRAIERFVPRTHTLAEGLEGGISQAAFERARSAVAGVLVVAEDDIASAMRFARSELRQTIEGSAATALVPILRGLPAGLRGGDVLCVLTGRNVDGEAWTSLAPPPAIAALAAALSSSSKPRSS